MTLEEIKEYYNYAVIIESAYNTKGTIHPNDEFILHKDAGAFFTSVSGLCLYDFSSGRKAKIISINPLKPRYKLEDGNEFKKITNSICNLLEHKNKNYGNSALEPLNIFSGKSKVGNRLDDKLARIKNSEELRKNDICDLIGYLILECKDRGWNNFDEFKD